MILGCPDAPVLAAFAEGTLDSRQRAEVEHHLANCPECPIVVAEVTHFLVATAEEVEEAEPPPPPRHARWWYIAAALAATCIALASWRTLRDPMRGVRRIAAQSPVRLYEGRLHDFPYAPVDARRDVRAQYPARPALRAEADRLAHRDETADVLHARGVLALLANDPREASRLLKRASDRSPDDAAILNDVAASEIARAAVSDAPTARVAAQSALAAATRAAALAPTSPAPHFNRALALQLLDAPAKAEVAWRRALELERSPAWQQEIHTHVDPVP